jgi:hypothetical protein
MLFLSYHSYWHTDSHNPSSRPTPAAPQVAYNRFEYYYAIAKGVRRGAIPNFPGQMWNIDDERSSTVNPCVSLRIPRLWMWTWKGGHGGIVSAGKKRRKRRFFQCTNIVWGKGERGWYEEHPTFQQGGVERIRSLHWRNSFLGDHTVHRIGLWW